MRKIVVLLLILAAGSAQATEYTAPKNSPKLLEAMMGRMAEHPMPPYGERRWTCFTEKRGYSGEWVVCRPFTIVLPGEEEVTHYRGYSQLKGRVRVNGRLTRID